MTDDLFGAQRAPATEVTPEVDLSEVEAKFGNDLDALKKAKAHSDAHIKNLEREQAELRKELETRLSLEQFRDEIISSKTPSSNSGNQPEENEQVAESVSSESRRLSRDDVARLVKETINQERTVAEKNRNRALVAEGLQKAWGSNFQSRLAQRAEELGMTREQFNELASASPAGFLAMVNPTPTSQVPNVSPPAADRRPSAGNQSTQTLEHYKKMRKEDPSRYWSPQVQKQIHRLETEAAARGEAFYS
jgi:hypothetical protein